MVPFIAQSSPTSPWLTVGIALIAAVTALTGAAIAAVTADRRQRRELAHDRELADVTELRAVLDEAAGVLARADRAILEVGKDRPLNESSEKVVDDLTATNAAMAHSAQRLRIRLGQGNPAYTAYGKALDAQRRFGDLVADLVAGRAQRGDEQSERASFEQGRDEFFNAAHQIVGSETGPESP
jgi:hypothetical protein